MDSLLNVMDPGGFSLELNWTHIDLPQKIAQTLKKTLKGLKRVQKGLKSGFFTHELDPLPNLMDPGGFSLDLN